MKKLTKHWLSLAEKDFLAADYLFNGARYPHAIYFLCQAIEKILKADLIESSDSKPPHTHNLSSLVRKVSFKIPANNKVAIEELDKHYKRVRHPDIAQVSYNTKKKILPIFNHGKKIYLWIRNQFKKN